MSSGRKNWSALSSLAQQWSAEDEEELERERRRRHRQLSSSSDVKEDNPEPVKNAVKKAPNRFRNSSEIKPSKLESTKQQNEKKSVETVNKVEELKLGNSKQQNEKKSVETVNKVEELKLGSSKQQNVKKSVETINKVEELKLGSSKQQNEKKSVETVNKVEELKLENSKQQNEKKLVETVNKVEDRWVRRRVETLNNVKQEPKVRMNVRKFEKEADGKNTKSLTESAPKQKETTTEKCQAQSPQKVPTEEKHHNRGQEKRELRKGKCENLNQEEKDLRVGEDEIFKQKQKVFSGQESPAPAKLQNEGPAKLPQRASWERRSISRLEVKINSRVRKSSEAAPATPASGSHVIESISRIDEVESSPSESKASSLVASPVITYSSSFKRITPRTISFRVVPKKDQQEDTLSRSASMRLPASSGKLEEKLERYTSAVQRAGSIKLPPSARRNFQPPLEGVASKRSIFEAQVKTEPTTPIRKESLKIPGAVTSRINLWISRTQEPDKDEGAKDSQRTENTVQQN